MSAFSHAALRSTLAAAGLALAAACAPDGDPAKAAPGASDGRLDELVELTRPLEETVTSDITDRRLLRARRLQGELREAGRPVGLAALEAFRQHGTDIVAVQQVLLDVAAYAAPDDTVELLTSLVLTTGPELGVRTRAAELLGETQPERAIEVLEPILRKARRSQTLPPSDLMLRAYVLAADTVGHSPVPVLCDVATNIYHEDAARHAACEELGKHPTQQGAKALEAILIESGGNAYIRRRAAQGLREALPRESACAIFERVVSLEVDQHMAEFLADMIEDNCW